MDNLLKNYKSVFQQGLGVKAEASPIFRRPKSTPFAIRADVGKELDRLEQEGIIKKV